MLLQLVVTLIILIVLVLSISRWHLHPFLALILAALSLGLLLGLGGKTSVNVLLEGFAATIKWIAIVVILGAFIGEVLNETGGAIRISDQVLKWVGQKRLPWAMGITGYLVSIPVFVDVAYILFHPITEALAKRSKTPVLVVGLALSAGLTVSHTLMPPTPGPLAVAALLDANIGRMLLINSFLAIIVVSSGVLWAKFFCKRFSLPFDKKPYSTNSKTTDLRSNTDKKGSVLMDLLPIIVPIIVMATGAFLASDQSKFGQVLAFISTPMIAVLIGAGIAAIQFFAITKKTNFSRLVESAIVKSALVIMITGAGGAFGYVIRESGIQDTLGAFFTSLPYIGVLLPFFIAAVLTSATGSITVSLIGAASILGPIAPTLPYSPEMLAALIACGSFCVFHANSSFFWLLNRLHNVPVNILYKTYTLQSLVMGLSGLIGIGILFLLVLDKTIFYCIQ
jgi:GntP family gluconate:H+ symporter